MENAAASRRLPRCIRDLVDVLVRQAIQCLASFQVLETCPENPGVEYRICAADVASINTAKPKAAGLGWVIDFGFVFQAAAEK